MGPLLETIVSDDPALRNRDFFELCRTLGTRKILAGLEELERFRRESGNLYFRVRATLFLYAACRFFLVDNREIPGVGAVPFSGMEDLLARRFEEAIRTFRRAIAEQGPRGILYGALAEAYHRLTFQTLADQVRRSVRASRGNQWMFRGGHADDHSIRIRKELLKPAGGSPLYPILHERTPVRLDLSHSGWSDIFFLGMDFPEGARVLNISVDLGVYGRDSTTSPPVESFFRVIPEPVFRLTSVDLKATKDVTSLEELFNFGNDYLSLLKAGVIASGLVPPSFEGTSQSVKRILGNIVAPGMGVELITKVNDIPKGSRLAVSTNLLASMIAIMMRATGQTTTLTGPLDESERRLAASRAILGEWLGGSGGGWQDSGGIWPGFKVIEGVEAGEGDPELGISKGCLLPRHTLLGEGDLHPAIAQRLAESLVLIHGGMAQNVGPILEMVTEKYLLRGTREWRARLSMGPIFDAIRDALREGDPAALGRRTTENWNGPLKAIIPWVTNEYTETIIARARESAGEAFLGFLMLGGMSGGGMGLFVERSRQASFKDEILEIMTGTKRQLEEALPFAMDPVVYDFRINGTGTAAALLTGDRAVLPLSYYSLHAAELARAGQASLTATRRAELESFVRTGARTGESETLLRSLMGNLLEDDADGAAEEKAARDRETERIKKENGFDPILHERLRDDLKKGRIGLARNRLPLDTRIDDVGDDDLDFLEEKGHLEATGRKALQEGKAAVLSLAAGVGSRWTSGAGVVKAVSSFVHVNGAHRSFLELHLARTARSAARFGAPVPHIVTTSYLTHRAVAKQLALHDNYGFTGPLHLSPGRSVGQRMIPMVRDLVFLWEETPQEILDEEKQKVRENLRAALMEWASSRGEGDDYTDNIPHQRLHPPGHWYEVANLLRNGVLARLLREQPQLETLMLHNIDTLGADLDPAALGVHLESGRALTFEVVPRQIEDRGGGLARVNGDLRLLEGLAQPREEDEYRLSYYNTMTTWIQIDPLLAVFGLTRSDLDGPPDRITAAVRAMAERMPAYVTIKDVKLRWGHGQEDVYPVAQVEKLWSDMTWLRDVPCGFLAVPRHRGRQLKDPDQLDGWANDGGLQHVARLCGW